MTIVAAEVVRLRLPLCRPLVTSQGALTIREGFRLHLTASTGQIGSGEASPAYWLGEGSLAQTADDLRRIVALVRARPRAAALGAGLLGEEATPQLSAAAACALDSALLDLESRTHGVALAALLGGEAAVAIAIAALVGGATPELLLAEVDAAVARGFTTLKLKVGGGALSDDVRRVAAVRTRVGNGVRLRLDANQAWTDEEARRALAALTPFAIEYVEEPLRGADPVRLAALARATEVPVAVDESIGNAADLQRVVAAGACMHVVLKPARVGGPTRLLALAQSARAAGLPVVVTDSIESAVGMRIAVHAAAALAAPRLAVGLGGAQCLAAEDGGGVHPLCVPVLVPTGPGLTVVPGVGVGEGVAHA